MNAFEKFDADRALRRQNIIPAWLQFRAAVTESVASYNRIEEGRDHPAEIQESAEKNFITINCRRESTTRGVGLLSIVLQTGITDQRIAIWAAIEFWQLVNDKPSSKETENFEFLVEAEADVHLSSAGNKITPSEAADMVLMKALMGIPAKANGIAVIRSAAA
jgi:hypothetical protein